jgi:hypothetical protein
VATDDLEWLGTWYQQQCNGRWEHQKGMLLEPLQERESTAWQLRIHLQGTSAAGFSPRRLHVRSMDGDWLRCQLSASRFEGAGSDVESVIGVFRRWVEGSTPDSESTLLETASAV